jgi:hypothetical protein
VCGGGTPNRSKQEHDEGQLSNVAPPFILREKHGRTVSLPEEHDIVGYGAAQGEVMVRTQREGHRSLAGDAL